MHVLLLSVLITVSAQGRAAAAPDMATENLTIATNASTAAAAVSDNNARYERLSSALKGMGIGGSDLRTTFYTVNYTPPPAPGTAATAPIGEPQRYGYFVNRTVQVTLNRLDAVGASIDAAVAAGVTDIGGVTFGVRDTRPQYALALASAVRDARAQAQAMAAAAGLHIIRVKSMQQGFAEAPVERVMMAARMPAPAPPTTIEPSSVEITANVTVTYEANER